ncbi:hypothetical protein ACS0TY_013145 [Phlomoides rotata]
MAKEWISSITPESLDSWEVLSKKFLLKYFPPSKTLQCKMEIAQFQQRDEENINDAWERFNSLLRKCPQHGNGDEQIVTFFYSGLCPMARQYIDASAGGSIFNLEGARARDMIDTIAANSCHWPTDHGRRYCVAQVEEGGANEVLAEAMKLLLDKVDKLSTKVDMNSSQGMEHCEEANYLGRPPYQQGNFQGNNQFQNTNPHQGFQSHNRYPQNQYPQNFQNNNSYNSKFSYANPKAALTLPPGVDPGGRALNNEGKPTLEEALHAFITQSTQNNTRMDHRMEKVEEQLRSLSGLPNQMKNLEFQLGQVASSSQTREKGKFLSTTEVNPREHCKAIALRSGTKYEGPSMPPEDGEEDKVEEEESKGEEFEIVDVRDEVEEKGEKKEEPKKGVWVPKWRRAREEREPKEDKNVKFSKWGVPLTPIPPPFPGRFMKDKVDEKYAKFLETFKNVTMNIPLLDALEEMPSLWSSLV